MKKADPEDEAGLISRISQKDSAAFSVIYHRYQSKLYTIALQFLKEEDLAEELIQEVFLKLWLSAEGLKTVRNIEAYLVTLVKNKAIDIYRASLRHKRIEKQQATLITEGENATEESILLNDARRVLESAIAKLPPQQKSVYQLCHQQGLDVEVVAGRLGISPLTVKKHLQLAMRFVRGKFKDYSDLVVLAIILRLI